MLLALPASKWRRRARLQRQHLHIRELVISEACDLLLLSLLLPRRAAGATRTLARVSRVAMLALADDVLHLCTPQLALSWSRA